jgi:glycosyltransferase involved in cell wall biosynthesis
MTDVTVVVLTYNEETNLPQCLSSLKGFAKHIYVVDSLSKDRTAAIAAEYGADVFPHPFENYADQRNWALRELPYDTEWVMFLDADEWLLPELKEEIGRMIARRPEENGFYIKRRLIFMGKWIRRGYYPSWILRLFRAGKAQCEERTVNEHLIVDGRAGYLQADFIHEDRKGFMDWVTKHLRYAQLEADELSRTRRADEEIDARFFGTQAQRKRWVRHKIWNRLPAVFRPFLYFGYRYLVRGGFLDGRAGFIYHFMQGLWFLLLIDVLHLEKRNAARAANVTER